MASSELPLIVIAHQTISRVHVLIQSDSATYNSAVTVIDQSSLHGTFMELSDGKGRALRAKKRCLALMVLSPQPAGLQHT